MPSPGNLEIEVHLEDGGAPQSMAQEVLDGLRASPKRIPSKYFYDERGSRLFEEITRLPEYYLTRTEQAILDRHAADMIELAGTEELVELGSGAARKIRTLIEAGLAAGSLRRYIPVEVSQEIVESSALALARAYPQLEVHALVGDFELHLGKLADGGRRTIAFLGSTIGNFSEEEAIGFLRKVLHVMRPQDRLLLSTDLIKDRAVIEAAYNDSAGVTADFNRNILNVLNRHLDGNFDPAQFEHVAFFDEAHGRIESYLRSVRPQSVRLAAIELVVELAEGERIWTEVSCKYDRERLSRMLAAAGMKIERSFTDDDRNFAVSICAPA